MKPAAFLYHAPRSLDEALSLMQSHGYDAKVLAGGQSLVPTMNFRLAQPEVLVDLNGIEELFYLNEASTGGLRIGAMTRQRTLERSAAVERRAPLLWETMPYIAHPQIRNRGTVGGSLAHADPAAELPAVAVTLGARMRLQSSRGERWVDAGDFYLGLFTTVVEPEELLVEVEIPAAEARTGFAFDEVARRHGDYAMAGAAAKVQLSENGNIREARLVYLSIGDYPERAAHAEQILVGEQPTKQLLRAAADAAATQDIDPIGDIHASAAYRRHLARILAARVLERSVSRARNGGDRT